MMVLVVTKKNWEGGGEQPKVFFQEVKVAAILINLYQFVGSSRISVLEIPLLLLR